MVKGRARVAAQNEMFDLVPDRLLVIPPGVEHYELPAERPTHYVTFWCDAEQTLSRMNEVVYWPPSTYQVGQSLQLPGRTNVENIIAAIASELLGRERGWLPCVRGLLNYLTTTLLRRLQRRSVLGLRSRESPTIHANAHSWRIVRAAVGFCDANFRKPLRLADVAAAAGYSPRHVSRLIRAHLGHSFLDHLCSLRMDAAKQLLEQSELGVSEIAFSIGYTDPSHFTRAFARFVGISPTAYRKRSRGLCNDK